MEPDLKILPGGDRIEIGEKVQQIQPANTKQIIIVGPVGQCHRKQENAIEHKGLVTRNINHTVICRAIILVSQELIVIRTMDDRPVLSVIHTVTIDTIQNNKGVNNRHGRKRST